MQDDPPPHAAEPAARKKKSRGARLSKAEREARREARLASAADDAAGGAPLERRRTALRSLVASEQWDAAAALGCESTVLALELLRALAGSGRERLLTHTARRLADVLGAASLAPAVEEAAAAHRYRDAAAIVRGVGVSGASCSSEAGGAGGGSAGGYSFGGVHELALRCFERGEVAEGAEILGGEPRLQLLALREMVSSRRAAGVAAQYLGSLSLLPHPAAAAEVALGREATPLLHGAPALAAAAAEAAEAIQAALRSAWPRAEVQPYGSGALGLGASGSDVDLCALLPGLPTPLSKQGRAALAAPLRRAAAALRRCGAVSDLRAAPAARTPSLAFSLQLRGGARRVDLTLNNVAGLANTHVLAQLLARVPHLRPAAAALRSWARSKGLCGGPRVPSPYMRLL